MELTVEKKEKVILNHLKLTTRHHSILIPRNPAIIAPIEIINPHLNVKYDWLYILTDQDTEKLKDKGFHFKYKKFFEDDWFARVYISMYYCDPNIMPYQEDGWYRGKVFGLRRIIFEELTEYMRSINNDYMNVNCLLSNHEHIFE
jgi:ribosomal protein L30/L7E